MDAIPVGTWREIRDRYPVPIQEFVDLVAERGPSLPDIYTLQAAVYRRAEWLLELAVAERESLAQKHDGEIPNGSTAPGASAFSVYLNSMTQSLKHLRMIAIEMGPPARQGDMPVRVPEGYGLDEVIARQAAREAAGADEIIN